MLTAEEYAMIDVLSGGRLDFGVGRGTPPELVGFGVKEDNRDRLVESLEVVEMAWREGRVSYQGQFHHIDDVSLNVLPVQRPLPPVYFAALSQGSYQVAGEKGYPIMGIPFASCKDMAEVKRKVAFYKETLSRSGHDPDALDVAQCIHTHVAESDAAARRRARPAMSRYYDMRKSVRPRSYDELDRERMLMVGGPAALLGADRGNRRHRHQLHHLLHELRRPGPEEHSRLHGDDGGGGAAERGRAEVGHTNTLLAVAPLDVGDLGILGLWGPTRQNPKNRYCQNRHRHPGHRRLDILAPIWPSVEYGVYLAKLFQLLGRETLVARKLI